jgi:hypothetical protein
MLLTVPDGIVEFGVAIAGRKKGGGVDIGHPFRFRHGGAVRLEGALTLAVLPSSMI